MVGVFVIAVSGTAIKRDPLRLRIGDVELRAVAVLVIADGARIEADAVQRVRDGAHGTIEFSGRIRAFQNRIRGDVDVHVLLDGLGIAALLAFVLAGRRGARLAGTVGLVVGAAVGDDRALRDALGHRDRLRIARGRAVRGAGVTAARRRRVGRAEQRNEEDQDAFNIRWRHVISLPGAVLSTGLLAARPRAARLPLWSMGPWGGVWQPRVVAGAHRTWSQFRR